MSIATDGHALMQAILDEPEEDLHRLVFADWLEENGQSERAEFIRMQIADQNNWELVGYTHEIRSGPPRGEREAFCGALLCKERVFRFAVNALHGTFPSITCEIDFRRGFLHTIRLPHDEFLKHGKAICQSHPVERVELSCRVADYWDGRYWWFSNLGWPEDRIPEGKNGLASAIGKMLGVIYREFEGELWEARFIVLGDDAYPQLGWGFASEKIAIDALSTVCLKYGRQP